MVTSEGFSNFQIKWYHDDSIVKEGERYRFINEGGFHCVDVAPVIAHDAGKWTCTAQNATNATSTSCYLNVLGKLQTKTSEGVTSWTLASHLGNISRIIPAHLAPPISIIESILQSNKLNFTNQISTGFGSRNFNFGY